MTGRGVFCMPSMIVTITEADLSTARQSCNADTDDAACFGNP